MVGSQTHCKLALQNLISPRSSQYARQKLIHSLLPGDLLRVESRLIGDCAMDTHEPRGCDPATNRWRDLHHEVRDPSAAGMLGLNHPHTLLSDCFFPPEPSRSRRHQHKLA